MATKLDARQSISRDLLDQIATATGKEVDDLLRSINEELTMPLRMVPSSPVDRVLTIENITVTNPETGRKRTIPTISNTLPAFTTGTVTFPATAGGTITVSPGTNATLTMSASRFLKVGVNMDATGSLTVTFGTEGVSEAAATAPPKINNTFAVGFVVVQTDGSSNVANITNANIYQYMGGGGGGGSGDANDLKIRFREQLLDSPYELLTPSVFSSDGTAYVHGSSTGTYSLVTGNFEFTAGAQTLVTTQLLDVEFLGDALPVEIVDLSVVWGEGKIDTSATYSVSRNGGSEWQTIDMERVGDTTETYQGSHTFTVEASPATLDSNATGTTQVLLDATTQQKLSQKFTLAATSVVRTVDLEVDKLGSPVGNIYVQVVRDSAGSPSTALTDILATSSAIDVTTLTTATKVVDIPDIVLTAADYHIVIYSDAQYKTNSFGSNAIRFLERTTGGTGRGTYNGTSWTVSGTNELRFVLKGIALDLRLRVTSSAGSKSIQGFGMLYGEQIGRVSSGVKKIDKKVFQAVANNTSTFTINFMPDPDLLEVYYVEAGQVFKYPAFNMQGQTIIFPANTFGNGGVEATVTLLFTQSEGTSFDNSDANAALLGANHLGSTDATIDKSSAGLGIFLRRPDGTLREIALDDSDNLVVYSV